MPPKLPPRDIWAIYRTAVLKYPLTRGKFHDTMSVTQVRKTGTKGCSGPKSRH